MDYHALVCYSFSKYLIIYNSIVAKRRHVDKLCRRYIGEQCHQSD